ncbi:MAG: class I SAM-dependent methyltransferase [Lachnoclostridium sp.]|nr:class I SAM-dependent methyltransferase [Lachnoclostridium sp.]
MDFDALRLKYSGDPVKLDEILQQECRERYASKFRDTLRSGSFRFPSRAVAEMATSDEVAQFHASLIDGDRSVLDMTFGLGIDAFHIARSGAEVECCEIDAHNAEVGRLNASGLDNVAVNHVDSIEFVNSYDGRFETIFVDPARRDSKGRHFSLDDCEPRILPYLDTILSKCYRLIVKCSPMLDVTALRTELGGEADIYAVGTRRECKELLAVVPGRGLTHAVTIGQGQITFAPSQEAEAATDYIDTPRGYLYEPYSAVMKAAPFKLLCSLYGVKKLGQHTHLYCSEEVVADFPGERLEIIETLDFNKRTMTDVARRYGMINVAVRNFPLSAPELARRLKVKEGGELRLFGATLGSGRKVLIITRP